MRTPQATARHAIIVFDGSRPRGPGGAAGGLTSPWPPGPPVYVHLLPALIPAGALRGGVAVVIDVLRATTTMIHALAAGCDAIIPCGEIDEARRVAEGLPP